MPETCENQLSFVNNLVYYVCHTHEIYQTLSNPVDFKAPWEL